jgi:hypothetical protein
MNSELGRRRLRPIGKLLAEDTKRYHRALILQHLFAAGPASRADLARATGLTRVTVSDLVGGLIDAGLLAELGPPAETKVGKPPTLVGLHADAASVHHTGRPYADAEQGAAGGLAQLLREADGEADRRLSAGARTGNLGARLDLPEQVEHGPDHAVVRRKVERYDVRGVGVQAY